MKRYKGIRFSDVDLQKVRQVVTQSKAIAPKMYELVKVAENEQQKNPNDFWIKSSTQDFKKAERFVKQLEKTILQVERNSSSGKPFKELFKKSVDLLYELGHKIAGAVQTDDYPTVNKLRNEVRQLQKSAFMTGMDVEQKTRNIEFDNQTRYRRGIRFSAEDDFAANYHKFSKTVLSDISALSGMTTAAKRMAEKGDIRWKKVYDMIKPLQNAQAVFLDRVNSVVTYVTKNNMIDNR